MVAHIIYYATCTHAGKHPEVPPFPFQDIRKKFRFLSLTTSSEAISVLEHIRVECGKVCAMSLFHTGVSKHLKLEEFDLAQQQASMQVWCIRCGVLLCVQKQYTCTCACIHKA